MIKIKPMKRFLILTAAICLSFGASFFQPAGAQENRIPRDNPRFGFTPEEPITSDEARNTLTG